MTNISVIYYHSVGPKNPAWRKNFLTLELPFFEDQLKHFSKYYNIISLKEYWEIRNGLKEPVKNAIVLTFDDGYLDNWQYVYPLLKKYGLKGTLFVSPEFVDLKNTIRSNLEDVWNGKAKMKDLHQWGFLSWEEMRIMEESGVMDIQSHTMTHTKYPVSDKLVGFHRPGADCLYYTGNLFPEKKPYYIEDPEFAKLLPYGFPVFEMQSASIARKVEINPEFINHCTKVLNNYNLSEYQFEKAFERVKDKYEEMRSSNTLIISRETEDAYQKRIRYEVFESKRIIEEKLNKTVEFLCWPHGDNNDLAHEMAMEAGYKATSLGKMPGSKPDNNRFDRLGLGQVRNNQFLSMLKARYKIQSYRKKQPWIAIKNTYEFFRDL